MSVYVEATCAMCGRDSPLNRPMERGAFQVIDVDRDKILRLLQKRGWIVQQNGENTDIYCSGECAK